MSLFGAKLHWKNRGLNFRSSNVTIPAVHRVDNGNRARTISSLDYTPVSVASVYADFEADPVSLKSRLIYQSVRRRQSMFSPVIHLLSRLMLY